MQEYVLLSLLPKLDDVSFSNYSIVREMKKHIQYGFPLDLIALRVLF